MSLALNEEALTLLFIGRLLVAVVSNFLSNIIDRKQVTTTKKVWVSNYFTTHKPIYINHLKGMNYSHSIVPGGLDVMS